jgi:hypothetical protein
MTELKEIRGLIEGHIADFRVFKTKLFGDDESEDAQGRIPRIEAKIEDHERRIRKGERSRWLLRGAVIFFCAVAAIAEFWYHVLAIVRH